MKSTNSQFGILSKIIAYVILHRFLKPAALELAYVSLARQGMSISATSTAWSDVPEDGRIWPANEDSDKGRLWSKKWQGASHAQHGGSPTIS